MQRSRLLVALGVVAWLCSSIAVAGGPGGAATSAAAGVNPELPGIVKPIHCPDLGPSTIVATPDGSRLVVACEDAKQILLVDPAKAAVVAKLAMPATPTGMAISGDGQRLYVTCADVRSVVAVVELPALKIVKTMRAGHTARGPALTPDGKRLYVCNRFQNAVAAYDLEAGHVVAQIPAVREPFAAVVTADGKSVFVMNHLPLDRSDSYDVAAQIQVIDTATNTSQPIRLINGSTGLRGMCLTPDGKYVLVTHILARYQMPTTQLERGWMNTNAVSISSTAEKKLVNAILLDDVDLGAANPWGVACTADGATVCIAHAGTHEMSAINLPGLLEKLSKVPADAAAAQAAAAGKKADAVTYSSSASTTQADVPNDLAFLVDLRRRIPVDGRGPRGVAVIGSKAYATQYFSDSVAVVDLASKVDRPGTAIALGPKPQWNIQRRGEALFNDATMCFQHWQSCGSCHPDSRVDGLNWDLMNDGLGNPKNNKSMLYSHATPPAMWTGVRPTGESAVRSGIKQILFIVRPEEEAQAIDEFLKALEPVPSPHLVHGQLSPAAERGKVLFHDEKVGCATCHPGPLYTDLKMHDVGSKGKYDREVKFDTPSLNECWRTAPYMHDGHWLTLKELFLEGQHGHKVGKFRPLTEKEIDDLVEFVLSL